MIKELISRLTMAKTNEEGIWDGVSDKKIYYWQDYYFNIYMASSRWGYRVKIK
jgi:limonene-1,2-epoxide hydrolase